MLFSALSLKLFCFISYFSSTISAGTCLNIFLYDTLGDGWGDANFFIETPSSQLVPSSPNCSVNPVLSKFCPDEEGLYYFMVLNGKDVPPENYWEIVFKLHIDDTGITYTGGFESTFVLDYYKDHWQLIHFQNMWSNSPNATSCGSSEYVSDGLCIPSPEPCQDKQDKQQKSPGYISKSSHSRAPISTQLIGKHSRGLVLANPTTKSPRKRYSSPKTVNAGGGGGGGNSTDEDYAWPSEDDEQMLTSFYNTSTPSNPGDGASVDSRATEFISRLTKKRTSKPEKNCEDCNCWWWRRRK